MNSQKLLFSTLCCLALTACATTAPLSSYPQAQVLEQDTNIEAYPTTTGNVAKLIKHDKQTCMIEFTGYLGGGQVTEHWIFNNKGLISAQSFTEQYPDSSGILSQATNSTTKSSTTFNIQDPEIQNNFKKLQSNFSKDNLAKCD
ncbi:hypothetical protein [Acinetobacter baumannii]|uniref:hypothetical protein n=1 Tax=Acinetobacter baumannii TaxID=470 RepID=UPI0004F790C6|nr:hypothetical protein [Acinetobacter baumannii]AIL73689.1 signal peptide protein [Acinetobacter baumannii]KAB1099671.1 hypothetical protein F6W73_13645 [Acinetobacter baumannii]MCV4242308.1 hypothetical protein [Acinetobacter baumannii]MDA4862041.1 hypothetical protein [Acinetobacter baumannii]MDC4359356.1 hypothetical protein [Acinetobacter baumannii]